MHRITTTPRPDWRQKVEAIGFDFHTIGDIYWNEAAYYEFSATEINNIETATAELWDMCLQAVQYVMDKNLYHRFHIPSWFIPHIERSWEEEYPSVYGRFDFCVRNGDIKLLEFNADTPTSLFESSIVQWFWLQERFPNHDQFNSIHEKLITTWTDLKGYLRPGKLHFASVRDSAEDYTTTRYLQDCAIQAGLNTTYLHIDEIGWDADYKTFIDAENHSITNIFKLYPYEWMVHEEFGESLMQDQKEAFWIEPSWKMLLANKALLPILWDLFPYHRLLLKSYFDAPRDLVSWCEKPLLSREGANVKLVENGKILTQTDGEYGDEGFIYQDLAVLPKFDNQYALVGSWIIGQDPAGIGIRESASMISDNMSCFVPHLIH